MMNLIQNKFLVTLNQMIMIKIKKIIMIKINKIIMINKYYKSIYMTAIRMLLN